MVVFKNRYQDDIAICHIFRKSEELSIKIAHVALFNHHKFHLTTSNHSNVKGERHLSRNVCNTYSTTPLTIVENITLIR